MALNPWNSSSFEQLALKGLAQLRELHVPWPTLTETTCSSSYVTDTCNIPIFSCTRISASRIHPVTWCAAAATVSGDELMTSLPGRRRGSRCSSDALPTSVLKSDSIPTTRSTSGLLFAGDSGGWRYSTNDRPGSVNVNASSSMSAGNDDFVDVDEATLDRDPRRQSNGITCDHVRQSVAGKHRQWTITTLVWMLMNNDRWRERLYQIGVVRARWLLGKRK